MLSRTHSLNSRPTRNISSGKLKKYIFVSLEIFFLFLYFNFLETIPYSIDHILIDAVSEQQNFELFVEVKLEVLLGHVCGTDIRSCVCDKSEDPWYIKVDQKFTNQEVVCHLNCYACSDWDWDPGKYHSLHISQPS